jgi:heme/copper-type cytochrome/quinol oxidase subunit 2
MSDRTPAGDRPTPEEQRASAEARPVGETRPVGEARPGETRPVGEPPATRDDRPVHDTAADTAAAPATGRALRDDVVARERSEFGGMKFGSAFFGWLTATGMAVLLTAIVAAAGAAVGLGVSGSTDEAVNEANRNASTIGIVGAIAVIVILFVAYFCGGYVAGRMARFDGAKQGFAVWLWAVIVAVVVAVLSLVLGSQYDILGNLNSFPRIPLAEGDVTLTGVITAVAVAIVSLVGAILGGLAGMRYHRRVDRAGLDGVAVAR